MNDNPAYELFDELGRGENTVVYRAYDLDLGRDVAVKVLNEQSRQDSRRVAQFLKEAAFLAQFEHENILRVYSVDKQRGWIVMELMNGTLAGTVAKEPMDPATVRSVMRQILGALDSLHQKGKVHGAVRPSNILINELGTAKLSDFEASESDGELRAPTGSKKNLAPELIRPEFGEFGPGRRSLLSRFYNARTAHRPKVRDTLSWYRQRSNRRRRRMVTFGTVRLTRCSRSERSAPKFRTTWRMSSAN